MLLLYLHVQLPYNYPIYSKSGYLIIDSKYKKVEYLLFLLFGCLFRLEEYGEKII